MYRKLSIKIQIMLLLLFVHIVRRNTGTSWRWLKIKWISWGEQCRLLPIVIIRHFVRATGNTYRYVLSVHRMHVRNVSFQMQLTWNRSLRVIGITSAYPLPSSASPRPYLQSCSLWTCCNCPQNITDNIYVSFL